MQWIRVIRSAFALCLALMSFSAHAGPLQLRVDMLNLRSIQTAEKNNDELYFLVTEYPSKGRPSTSRVPMNPLYWPSEELPKLRLVQLWEKTISEGESVTLLFSLMEQDAPPWNTDDLVGEIKVHIKNEKGRLLTKWVMPNRADAPTWVRSRYGIAQKIDFANQYFKYELYLMLHEQDAKKVLQ